METDGLTEAEPAQTDTEPRDAAAVTQEASSSALPATSDLPEEGEGTRDGETERSE